MRRRALSRSNGFTYVGLIVLVAIIGLVGAATLKVNALLRRAAAEQELLDIGAGFSEALRTYAEATPRGQPTQPPSLQELLKDPRFPALRRHLRKIFIDPVTGKAEWGIVWVNPDSRTGVLAVYSLSDKKPFKVANFDARFVNFENKEHISEWKFAATGQAVVQGQAPGQVSGQASAQGQANTVAGQGQAGQPSLFPPNAANAAPAAAQNTLFPTRAPAVEAPPPPPPAAAPVAPPAPPAAPPVDPAPADPPQDSTTQEDADAKEAAARDAESERR